MTTNRKIYKKILLAGLLFLLAGTGLLAPQKTNASIVPGLPDTGAMLMPYIQPITSYLLTTATDLIKNGVYLSIAGQMMQAAVSNPQWINVRTGSSATASPFVTTGLNFTLSIANIMLIVAFIVIAFGFIFKIDNMDSAKALPKFLIAALLVNFGPLFVGMMVDIGNIFNSSVMVGNPNIFVSTCNLFMKDMLASAASIIGTLIIGGAGAMLVGANLLKAGIFLATVPGLLLGEMPSYLIQIMIGQILSALVFSNAIFFISRIFVMQILTILSPLAILARSIPRTEHWFKTWLDWLLSWTMGGILILFLLTLGFSSVSTLIPDMQELEPSTYGAYKFVLSEKNLHWMFLAVYMIVIDSISALVVVKGLSEIKGKMTGSAGSTNRAAGQIGKETRSGLQRAFDSKTGLETVKTAKKT